jgi:Ca-activated chloride channel family protein
MNSMTATIPGHYPNPSGRLVSTTGTELPLMASSIKAVATAGFARVTLIQSFANTEDTPLTVTYKVPLPADGTVSGYRFQLADDVIEGVVNEKAAARVTFEQALVDGRTAAILEEENNALFTQMIGNIPPQSTIHITLTIDQPLHWNPNGSWEWRFPTVVAPRYLGDVKPASAAALQIDVADGDVDARFSLALEIQDDTTGPADSPSHEITITPASITIEGAELNRDIVVSWPVAQPDPSLSLDTCRPDGAWGENRGFGRLTIVPPVEANSAFLPRDLVLLLDISGSMCGAPLHQAKTIVSSLIQGLNDNDCLEVITFASDVRHWQKKPVFMRKKHKQSALEWVGGLTARGGTDMVSGILAAVNQTPVIKNAQRQILLVTDGYIGSHEIISNILLNRPVPTRVHALAVGSAPNRTLTEGVARAGQGVEVFVDSAGATTQNAIDKLDKYMRCPVIVDLEVTGDALDGAAPRNTPDLFSGSPFTMHLPLSPEGGELTVVGRTQFGTWTQSIIVPATKRGEGAMAIATSWARDRVTQLETARMAGHGSEQTENDITDLGLGFSISTRLTSWVAISRNNPTKRTSRLVNQPHAVPAGVNIERFGLRHASRASSFQMPLLSVLSHATYALQSPLQGDYSISEMPKARVVEDLCHGPSYSSGAVLAGSEKESASPLSEPELPVFEKEVTETSLIKRTINMLFWLCISPILLLIGIAFGVYLLVEKATGTDE